MRRPVLTEELVEKALNHLVQSLNRALRLGMTDAPVDHLAHWKERGNPLDNRIEILDADDWEPSSIANLCKHHATFTRRVNIMQHVQRSHGVFQ